MNVTHKKRLYCLVDKDNLFYYVENDVVKKQPFPAFNLTVNSPFLLSNPIGWKDEEISWTTGDHYMLNRSFNLALDFVYEGARIIRERLYKGNGYEEEMYLLILKWNREDDVYYQEYRGKLDFSTCLDNINGGIRVSSIEGGIFSYLNANKSTTYEIPCDETNAAIKLVLLDGMNLSETLNYSFLEVDLDGGYVTIVPLSFINNEGDHVYVLYGSPLYEQVTGGDPGDYFMESNNYIVKNVGPTNILFTISGNLSIREIDSDGQSGTYRLYYQIASETELVIPNNNFISIPFPAGASNTPFSFNVALEPGQKLFFYHQNFFTVPEVTGGIIKYGVSTFKISFVSRKIQSTSFCLTLYDYYKQLVLKLTDGKYTGESLYLQSRPDLVCTCGDALRNTDREVVKNYMIASSMDDFFKSVPGDKGVGSSVGLQIRGNVLYLELLTDLYNDDTQIYDLGEVSGLRFRVAQEVICNTLQNGYPDQEYDTNGGKLEVNSEQDWQLPVLSNRQVFDIRSIWRADPRGIEQIRSTYTHLDTTDNSGDKEPFIINVSTEPITQSFTASRVNDKEYTGTNWLDYDTTSNSFGATMQLDSNGYIVRFTGTFNRADIYFFLTMDNDGHTCQVILFKNGQSIAVTVTNDTDGVTPITFFIPNEGMSLNDNFEVRIIPFDVGFEDFTVLSATLYFEFLIKPLTLFREVYDSITGVLDDSVYNVELRPRNQIIWHGNELRGRLIQQQSKNITLNTAAKNTNLSTTINGVTETENAPIKISSLADPLYLPYDAVFTTQVPYTFTDLLAMSTSGYFTWTYEGYRFYGLPWGTMKSKPARNEAQEWQLRLAARNLFTDMLGVSYADIITLTTNNNNMVAVSIYSPLHFIKYNYTPQSKYHHIDMHEDWSYKRFQNWVHVPFYTQKWQTTDTIKIPLLTSGLGAMNVFVYDRDGNQYGTYAFSVITTQYVKLPFVLQECDISLNSFAAGLYLFVIQAPDGTPVWISEWCDIKENWKHTFLIKYSNTENEKNLPWKAYNGFMEIRVEAEFGQWEPDSEAVDYEDDTADFTILSNTPLQKRALLIGHVIKVPEWMGLKINSILLKDKVYIDGDDESKHYTRRAATQMEPVRYSGMPWMSYSIEVIPATNPTMLVEEDLPVNEVNGWHATIDAQVFGLDTGTTDITILNQ